MGRVETGVQSVQRLAGRQRSLIGNPKRERGTEEKTDSEPFLAHDLGYQGF